MLSCELLILDGDDEVVVAVEPKEVVQVETPNAMPTQFGTITVFAPSPDSSFIPAEPDEPFIEMAVVIAEINKEASGKSLLQLPVGNNTNTAGNNTSELLKTQVSTVYSSLLHNELEYHSLVQVGVLGDESPQARRLKQSIAFLKSNSNCKRKSVLKNIVHAILSKLSLSTTTK